MLITWKRLLLMIPCFAAWAMPGLLLREWIVGNPSPLALPEIARVYGFLLLTFSLWFNLITAPLWNRRANALGAPCH